MEGFANVGSEKVCLISEWAETLRKSETCEIPRLETVVVSGQESYSQFEPVGDLGEFDSYCLKVFVAK